MAETPDTQEMSKEEQIGFHKGSIATLSKEREEMIKIVQICEQLMQMHIKALGELGVNIDQPKTDDEKKNDKAPEKRVPIESLI